MTKKKIKIEGRRPCEQGIDPDPLLRDFRHIPVYRTERLMNRQEREYKVVTVNWTFATVNGRQNENMVHRNL